MKLLFISPSRDAYGSERSMLTLLSAGQFVAEVVCPVGGPLGIALQRLGVQVHHLEFGKYSFRGNPFWNLKLIWSLRRTITMTKPDALVINLDGNTPHVIVAAVSSRIPVIRFSRFELASPTRWIDRWCWSRCQVIMCPSDAVRNSFRSWAPARWHSKLYTLYESYTGFDVSPGRRTGFRAKFGLGEAKVIGYVGRLHREKGLETAIRAFSLVRAQLENARLVIVGSHDGSADGANYKAELERLAQELRVHKDVIFTGYIDAIEMAGVFASFDLCVLPSESESFGIVVIEAWAQSVPTVASDVGGCAEITRASGGGYLVPVGDAQANAQKILALLNDSAAAANMGRKGRIWVQANCNPDSYAKRFTAIVTKVLGESPNPLYQ